MIGKTLEKKTDKCVYGMGAKSVGVHCNDTAV